MSDYLSNEVMMEILARLPVRTLLQIRCVCKSWCSLIGSENFVTFCLNRTTHLNSINNTHLLLIRHYTEDEKQEHFSLYFDNETLTEYHLNLECRPIARNSPYFDILGSCNGLVCLIDYIRSDFVYLWNPTIRKLVELPEPRITFRSHGSHQRALGYGFDSTTNDYKVVRIAYLDGGSEVDIYSLKEGCWRRTSVAGEIPKIQCDASNAFLNGAVHWLCNGYPSHISSFNLGSEVFSSMELPKSLRRRFVPVHRWSLAVFQGSLCVFQNDGILGETSIWMMKQYSVVKSWTNVFSLDTNTQDSVKVLGLRRNGEVFVTKDKDEEMFSFNTKDQKVKSLGMYGADKAFCVNTYTESLVLIDKVNGGFGEKAWSSQLQAP